MNPKRFQFNGTAGGYFVVTLVSLITAYIPVFGWPIGFNFQYNWLADNLLIDGKKVKYQAGYGETLVFLLVGILLTIVTLGIYSFWFGPKTYRYILDHSSYVEDGYSPVSAQAAAPVAQPVQQVTQSPVETPIDSVLPPEPPVQPPTTPIQG